MNRKKQKSVLRSFRVIAAVLCLSMCVVLLCPAVSVSASSDYEPGAYKYSFHVQGNPHYVEDKLVYDYDHIVSINGDDVDFFSYYSYYWDNGHKRADYFVLYAVSDKPFTWVDNYNDKYYSKSSQSKVVDGKTVYYGNILGIVGSIENENDFGTYVGSPNLKYVEHEFGVDGFTYVQDLINERLKEFVENGGLDWEPDESNFKDFYLTGVSFEELSKDKYKILWTGTSLGDDINSVSNGFVSAFTIFEYTNGGGEENIDLGSSSLQSGEITIDLSPWTGLTQGGILQGAVVSWDGKVYLSPSFDYGGEHYKGAYLVFDTKTKNLYNVSSSEGSKTYTWNDFFLSNVKLTKDLVGYYKISWTGTTRSADLIYIPDSDTVVVAAIALQDSHGNIVNREVATTTIGKGYFYFNVDDLLDLDSESAYYWDSYIYLTPCFTKDGDLYMGQFSVVNALSGDIYQDVIDEENNTVHREPVTDGGSGGSSGNSLNASSMIDYVNTGFNFLHNLIVMMSGFPALVAAVFQFIPSMYVDAIAVMLIIVFIARVLGR